GPLNKMIFLIATLMLDMNRKGGSQLYRGIINSDSLPTCLRRCPSSIHDRGFQSRKFDSKLCSRSWIHLIKYVTTGIACWRCIRIRNQRGKLRNLLLVGSRERDL